MIILSDIDGESYYPNLMINCNMIPKNAGKAFIDEFGDVVRRRVAAKRSGDTVVADTLKISVNGTFGKTGSRWSALYSPELMLATTLTGQLTLLMLIERLEKVGAIALSANTDGIAVGYSICLKDTVERIVSEFSALSNITFEYTPYRALALKDVNNYIAVKKHKDPKKDRSVKAKGIYAPVGLSKNPTAPVCARAVCEWLAHGTPFMETIKAAPFTDFISSRGVEGGGVQGDEQLGDVVRWYQTTDADLGPLRYASNGNKVPKTDGARACMIIEDKINHPSDLDYLWYYKEAIKIASNVGCSDYLTPEEITLVARKVKERKQKKEEAWTQTHGLFL